mmetsp:Transcript_40070/g.70527  ORF Transcript_40070/g.70527 Transcript_40070/m.70527 type:complete len:262 (+) Transcript_40070:302-1087(+)
MPLPHRQVDQNGEELGYVVHHSKAGGIQKDADSKRAEGQSRAKNAGGHEGSKSGVVKVIDGRCVCGSYLRTGREEQQEPCQQIVVIHPSPCRHCHRIHDVLHVGHVKEECPQPDNSPSVRPHVESRVQMNKHNGADENDDEPCPGRKARPLPVKEPDVCERGDEWDSTSQHYGGLHVRVQQDPHAGVEAQREAHWNTYKFQKCLLAALVQLHQAKAGAQSEQAGAEEELRGQHCGRQWNDDHCELIGNKHQGGEYQESQHH